MYSVPVARAWWLAVGPRLDRRVRPRSSVPEPSGAGRVAPRLGGPERNFAVGAGSSSGLPNVLKPADRVACGGRCGGLKLAGCCAPHPGAAPVLPELARRPEAEFPYSTANERENQRRIYLWRTSYSWKSRRVLTSRRGALSPDRLSTRARHTKACSTDFVFEVRRCWNCMAADFRGLTFEVRRGRRQGARPGPQIMYRVPVARAW